MTNMNEDFDPRELNENKQSLAERTSTENKAGGEAFDPHTAEFSLFKQVINCLLEDTYYQDAEAQLKDVDSAFDSVADENPEFVLQLATYARQEEGFRDIAQVLLVLSAFDDRTKEYVRAYTPSIIDRTDEFNTVVSLCLNMMDSYPSKPLKKGITDALHKQYGIVEVSYSGTSETERVTWIEGTDGDQFDDARDDAIDRAVATVRERNGISGGVHGELLADAEMVDEGYVHDEYTFSKYTQRNKEVSLHDVINLVRPNPRSNNRDEMFGRIVMGELDDYEDIDPLREDRTWESTRSDDEDDRSEAEQWRDRLDDMGLMARVRNLRNMRQAGLAGSEIFNYDENAVFGEHSEQIVRNSQMFPFRFYQAFKACQNDDTGGRRFRTGLTTDVFELGSGSVLDEYSEQWLNEAMTVSVDNLPDALTNTFVVADLSGSMSSSVSSNSEMECAEIAALFTAVLMKHGADGGAFASNFVRFRGDIENMSVLELAQDVMESSESVGGSTNGWKVLDGLHEDSDAYDRVVFLTDLQLWDSTVSGLLGHDRKNTFKDHWDAYAGETAPGSHLYTLDLASYGDLVMPEGYHNVHQVSGWSTNIIDYIVKNEQADDVIADIGSIGATDY